MKEKGQRDRGKPGKVAEGRGWIVAALLFEGVPVNAAAEEPWRRAGLEASEFEAQFAQRAGNADGRTLPETPALGFVLTGVHEGPHKGARGQHNRRRGEQHI